MNKQILTKINKEKGFDYYIDKEGNVIKSSYNWFKDRTTLVVLVLIILGGLYYFEMSNSRTNAKNFDSYCSFYYPIREEFVRDNLGVEPTFELVMKYYEDNKMRFSSNLNIPNG